MMDRFDELVIGKSEVESLSHQEIGRDRKSTRLNSSHRNTSRMPSSA